ncbi:hypothetical protein KFU94_07670 [Chloroflexi bacterium TSY]|nr:hypothetical protein [Chloroflexi bacterium TSY]
MSRTKLFPWVAILMAMTLLLAACAPESSSTPTQDSGDSASTSSDGTVSNGEITRAETIYLDAGVRRDSSDLWNPFVPGDKRSVGYHQSMSEPLFILNYETGEIEPWLGTEMTHNETLDVWTLSLRDGVEWSDGEVFNADDVVFTINMLKENAPELHNSGQVNDWIDNVEALDDLTVQFNLTNPNPRFQLDFFSVKIWGGINIVPEHVWNDKDPLTFTFYDPDQGWPVATGAYMLESASETEWTYVRNDNWWGAKSGWKELPAPRRLVWTAYGPD